MYGDKGGQVSEDTQYQVTEGGVYSRKMYFLDIFLIDTLTSSVWAV